MMQHLRIVDTWGTNRTISVTGHPHSLPHFQGVAGENTAQAANKGPPGEQSAVVEEDVDGTGAAEVHVGAGVHGIDLLSGAMRMRCHTWATDCTVH